MLQVVSPPSWDTATPARLCLPPGPLCGPPRPSVPPSVARSPPGVMCVNVRTPSSPRGVRARSPLLQGPHSLPGCALRGREITPNQAAPGPQAAMPARCHGDALGHRSCACGLDLVSESWEERRRSQQPCPHQLSSPPFWTPAQSGGHSVLCAPAEPGWAEWAPRPGLCGGVIAGRGGGCDPSSTDSVLGRLLSPGLALPWPPVGSFLSLLCAWLRGHVV